MLKRILKVCNRSVLLSLRFSRCKSVPLLVKERKKCLSGKDRSFHGSIYRKHIYFLVEEIEIHIMAQGSTGAGIVDSSQQSLLPTKEDSVTGTQRGNKMVLKLDVKGMRHDSTSGAVF